ncbi:DUF3899 domain-containing protein [Salipaludibacillus neizhouensis]|nr:DUF3899 domain-containing protein [Salipaludibacillus neizhouensis]
MIIIIFLIMLIIFFSSIVTTFFFSTAFTLLNWVNILFIFSLVVTMGGAILHIIQVGFFNSFIKNFNYFLRRINRTEEVISELERRNDRYKAIDSINLPIRVPIVCAGVILLALSTMISLVII